MRRLRRNNSLFIDFVSSGHAFNNIASPFAETTRPAPIGVDAIIDDVVPHPRRLITEPWRAPGEPCRLSLEFKSSLIQLCRRRKAAQSVEKGWASVFGTHGSDQGSWYFEAKILRIDETIMPSYCDDSTLREMSGVVLPPPFEDWREDYELICGPPYQRPVMRSILRVGWSCRYARYDMPVGHSPFSVALCSATGYVMNDAKRYPYCDKSDLPLKIDDVLGCRLHLHSRLLKKYGDPRRQPQLQYYVSGGMLCDPDHLPEQRINEGSFMEFSLNGKMLGRTPVPAIFEGVYHPAVSLFNGASVSINFGPHFKFLDKSQAEEYMYRAAADLPRVRV
eukprot:Lankesteria_metandrocarpae@DN3522_c0_g1_i1.p1